MSIQTSTKKEVKVTMTLNEAEAIWLRHVMQNPMHENETSEDGLMREVFFRAMHYGLADTEEWK